MRDWQRRRKAGIFCGLLGCPQHRRRDAVRDTKTPRLRSVFVLISSPFRGEGPRGTVVARFQDFPKLPIRPSHHRRSSW